MNLNKLFFVNNDCYKAGKKHIVRGIMVHSTVATNQDYGTGDSGNMPPWIAVYVWKRIA